MRQLRSTYLAIAPAAFALAAFACGGGSAPPSAAQGNAAATVANDGPNLCFAVRGNGGRILTHFAALARVIEHYGIVDGMAGGSSGSISTFVYESMLKNPAVRDCSGAPCSNAATSARLSLLLRSTVGYVQALATSADALSVMDLATVAARIKTQFDAKGISGLMVSDVAQAGRLMLEIFSSADLRDIVNPEALAMLTSTTNVPFNVREVYNSATSLGNFDATQNRIFFRPGIVSFTDAASLFGRVGDFYAGYGPSDRVGTAAFLDACADPSLGKTWADVANLGAGSTTCGTMFAQLVGDYRGKLGAAEGKFASRLDEHVGDGAVLTKLVGSSVLVGNAIAAYSEGRRQYLTGAYPDGTAIPFNISFDDVHLGYFGSDALLSQVGANPRNFTDAKTQKFLPLGDQTWRIVLSTSPAEPGLSHLNPLPDGRIAGGGWADLAPVLVLRNAGCKQVVYATRQGIDNGFSTNVATLLGMPDAEKESLYDLGNADSGLAKSIAQADAVLCTNWDNFPLSQYVAMVTDTLSSPLEVRTPFFQQSALRPDTGQTARAGKPGCTPGVTQ